MEAGAVSPGADIEAQRAAIEAKYQADMAALDQERKTHNAFIDKQVAAQQYGYAKQMTDVAADNMREKLSDPNISPAAARVLETELRKLESGESCRT